MRNLKEDREILDDIDKKIIGLLEERMKIIKEVGLYKLNNNLNTEDKNREKEIIEKLESEINLEFKNIVKPIYKEIFSESKKITSKIKNENFKYGLIGESLSHSKSKEIHELLADYTYNLRDIKREELDEFFESKKFKGINVTIPYKEASMKYLDDIDNLAKEIGAVNTIVNRDGRLIGYNTDYLGFDYSLKFYGIDLKGKKILILGSGGASKMLQKLVIDKGAEEFVVISRSSENNYDSLEKFSEFEVIINATPVGMYPNNMESKVDLNKFNNIEAVIDLIYNPLKTKLLLDGEKLNIKTMSGLMMLVAQAFFACELFLDKKLDESLIIQIYKKLKSDMENIILIGMPSSGKTTMGKSLAEELNREFFDIDKLIEDKEDKTIPEVFEEKGEEYFRDLESKVLEDISKENGLVIASGGGTPLRKENRDYILQNSIVIYLKRGLENLETSGRPLSKNLEDLKKLYSERKGIYEDLAQIKIDVIEDKKENLNLILKEVENYEIIGD
ncbi:shikimate kinase [Peptoniphilus harei]|uniref:shikimate kinase n=1 Tax=Peptoniphilus harei TaxID=54005 RepID=UPI002582D34F|nr:shikimate kinase [Peptoniphilus harei]MDU6743164.1 shikimate kinase [Peptoniphilus harei]